MIKDAMKDYLKKERIVNFPIKRGEEFEFVKCGK
jgi:hypothetical protein